MATLELAIRTTKVKQGANDFIQATVQVKGAAASATSGVNSLNQSLSSTGMIMSSVRTVAMQFFSAFLAIQGVKEAIKTFADFEQTMASLKGVTEATANEMDRMKAVALRMGASSRSSANQAAEGLLILAKAGFSAGDSIKALPGILALATAHQLDLGAASDYTANIINQFKLSAEQTNRVVDVLSTTANKSLSDVRDLAEAMKYAGPTAGALGISIEEAAAAAGVLSDRGIKASLAGTNLRGIMVDLINPTAKARATLESMGLTVQDISIKTHGFTGAMANLAKAGASVEDMAKIFGVMQVSGATALVQNIKRLKELTSANLESAGSTKLLVDIMQNTLMGRFKEFINILGDAAIMIGDSGLGKSLKDLLVIITDAIRLMLGFDDKLIGSKETAEEVVKVIKVTAGLLGILIGTQVSVWLAGIASSMAVATLATATWNSSLAVTSSILTALMALEFGKYLYDEFAWVRGIADFVANQMLTAANTIQYYWEVLVIKLKALWHDFINYSADELVKSANRWSGWINKIAPGSGLAASVMGTSMVLSGVHQSQRFDEESLMKQAQARRSADQANIDQSYLNIQNDASNEFAGKSRKGHSFFDYMANSSDSLVNSLNKQIGAWYDLSSSTVKANSEATDAIDGTSTAVDKYIERQMDMTIVNEEAHNRMLKLIDDTKEEAIALASSQRERSIAQKMALAQATAEDAYGKEAERTIKVLKEYKAALNSLEDAKADHKMLPKIQALRDEQAALFLSNKERRVAVEVARFQAEAEDMYGKKSELATQRTAEYRAELEKLVDLEELRGLADNIGDEFGQAFTDMIFGAKSAKEAVEGLTKAVIQLVFQQMVAKQLSTWISGGIMGAFGPASANGNVFNNGSLVPFARGGIVGGPTVFPMTGGKTGLMGENGPEAIMPLSRGSSGKLGVEVTGHATRVTNVNMTVVAKDPNEFRESQPQLIRRMRRSMR